MNDKNDILNKIDSQKMRNNIFKTIKVYYWINVILKLKIN